MVFVFIYERRYVEFAGLVGLGWSRIVSYVFGFAGFYVFVFSSFSYWWVGIIVGCYDCLFWC